MKDTKQPRDKIFPYPLAVVLYNGKKVWRNFRQMHDLIESPPGMDMDILRLPSHLGDRYHDVREVLAKTFGKILSVEEENTMYTIADRLRDEGKAEGRIEEKIEIYSQSIESTF